MFKETERSYLLSTLGFVIIFFVFYNNFDLKTTICFMAGFGLLLITREVELYKKMLGWGKGLKRNLNVNSNNTIDVKLILLTAFGLGFIIFALIGILEPLELFLLVVGLALILLSFQLVLKSLNKLCYPRC